MRWLDDGNVEYIGRAEHQVKIRGFHIELGEIELQLRRIDGEIEVTVIAQESAELVSACRLCSTEQ